MFKYMYCFSLTTYSHPQMFKYQSSLYRFSLTTYSHPQMFKYQSSLYRFSITTYSHPHAHKGCISYHSEQCKAKEMHQRRLGTRLVVCQPLSLILRNEFLVFLFHVGIHFPRHGILYVTVAGNRMQQHPVNSTMSYEAAIFLTLLCWHAHSGKHKTSVRCPSIHLSAPSV